MNHLTDGKLDSENCKMDIEVMETCIIVAFDRKLDHLILSWQDANDFGETLEKASCEVIQNKVINPFEIEFDQAQVRLNIHNGFVYLFFEYTDRIKLCPMAGKMLAASIKLKAQDAMLAEMNGIHHIYGSGPNKNLIKKVINVAGPNEVKTLIPGRN